MAGPVRENAGVPAFVGRAEPLARLTTAYRTVAAAGDESPAWAGVVLVTGEAGIGKTALLMRFAAVVDGAGGTVVWGTCWDDSTAPAWWPWTQALRALLDRRAGMAVAVRPELAAIVPDAATGVPAGESGRLRVLDAAADLLRRAAADGPVVVILDDLQWADESTVELMRFLARRRQLGAVLLVGAYRPYGQRAEVAAALADLASIAEPVPLRGLSAGEIAELVRVEAGASIEDGWVSLVHERSGGHPFYARELCHLLATTGTVTGIPAAVREVIRRRLDSLSADCVALLEAVAVGNGAPTSGVLAEVTGEDPSCVAQLVEEAVTAGILDRDGDFVHDLYRETVCSGLPRHRRLELHHAIAQALARRHEQGREVFATELARHFTAAVTLAGTEPALAWARAAARADTARSAFAEAAGHLARVRSAVTARVALADAELIGLLTDEAELRVRAGDVPRARELLDLAWSRSVAAGTPELLGTVALGLDRIDPRFAMPRTELVAVLQTAREALSGAGTSLQARVTAALARQLQHSVAADRAPARSLAEEAVAVARGHDDPGTLASCLLAQHDALWTPGTAADRAAIAAEIADLAKRAGDPERHAQALLLSATAQLESGSAAFRATLAEYAHLSERLRQPRHDYLLRTRQAALALLDGDIDTGERLSTEAAALGASIGEDDTGNVRMSQRLEVVRARHDPAQLRAMAGEAVSWWIGAPAHAHAVAAGFLARAGDLDAARRELDIVLSLDDWRADRSYLWSIFVGEMVTAAIALHDRALSEVLLDDLLPLADTCAVNGALVCFMGAHAHRVGLLHAALGHTAPARDRLRQGLEIHQRLGARAWQAESHEALAALGGPQARHHAERAASLRAELGLAATTAPPVDVKKGDATGGARLRRTGELWEATFADRTVHLRDAKGLRDLAILLARPGVWVPALELAGGEPVSGPVAQPEPVLDRTAVAAYRQRLAGLSDEIAAAQARGDAARRQRATEERQRLLTELRQATRPGGVPRGLGPSTSERARKAVTARIRDAIRRIGEAHPQFGRHLDRAIRTGTHCRYEP